MCLSLSISVSLCLCVYVSVCICVSVSVCLCVSASLSICQSICLSICLSVYLSVCLSIYLCVCLSVCLSICFSTCVPTCLPLAHPQALSVSQLLYLCHSFLFLYLSPLPYLHTSLSSFLSSRSCVPDQTPHPSPHGSAFLSHMHRENRKETNNNIYIHFFNIPNTFL